MTAATTTRSGRPEPVSGLDPQFYRPASSRASGPPLLPGFYDPFCMRGFPTGGEIHHELNDIAFDAGSSYSQHPLKTRMTLSTTQTIFFSPSHKTYCSLPQAPPRCVAPLPVTHAIMVIRAQVDAHAFTDFFPARSLATSTSATQCCLRDSLGPSHFHRFFPFFVSRPKMTYGYRARLRFRSGRNVVDGRIVHDPPELLLGGRPTSFCPRALHAVPACSPSSRRNSDTNRSFDLSYPSFRQAVS